MMKAVRCSNDKCAEVFHIHDMKIPGGINDRNEITIKCLKCGALSKVMIHNAVGKWRGDNYEVVDIRDLDDNEPYINSPNVAMTDGFEDINAPLHSWEPSNDSPMWRDTDINFELSASNSFNSVQKIIDKCMAQWDNGRLKSMPCAIFEKIFISQNYKIGKKKYTAIWFKEIGEGEIHGSNNFYLIHHSKANNLIDGIYSRDQSLCYLERLLVRWRALCSEVIVATPFIGYDFPFSKQKDKEELIELWDLLNGLLDMNKTIFFTRPRTYGALKKNQASIELVPADVRKKWDLMSNLQKVVDDPKTRAKMKKSFHLKIYVGVFDAYVELFSGSFNVQKNSTIENMALRRLGKNQFKKNYMDVMVDKYSYRIPQEEKALFVNIDLNDNISSKVLNLKDINQILAKIK